VRRMNPQIDSEDYHATPTPSKSQVESESGGVEGHAASSGTSKSVLGRPQSSDGAKPSARLGTEEAGVEPGPGSDSFLLTPSEPTKDAVVLNDGTRIAIGGEPLQGRWPVPEQTYLEPAKVCATCAEYCNGPCVQCASCQALACTHPHNRRRVDAYTDKAGTCTNRETCLACGVVIYDCAGGSR
jgi:hypothetical protein